MPRGVVRAEAKKSNMGSPGPVGRAARAIVGEQHLYTSARGLPRQADLIEDTTQGSTQRRGHDEDAAAALPQDLGCLLPERALT